MKIGIQGGVGSTNERACLFFAKKYNWDYVEIEYLITSESVLKALNAGEIDFGTFAWESSNGGLVTETREAIKKYGFQKVDEEEFQLDHALMYIGKIDEDVPINIYSHPQALKGHKSFLESRFSTVRLIEEVDTAVAAEKLKNGQYPQNSMIIAPIKCAELYNLDVLISDLPTNNGYRTRIFLIKKKSKELKDF